MGGGGKSSPTLEDVGNALIDTTTAVTTGGWSLTKEGSAATGKAKKEVKNIAVNIAKNPLQANAEIIGGGLVTQTDKGKETVTQIEQTAQQIGENLSGETARREAERQATLAEQEAAQRKRDLEEQDLKKRKVGEYGRLRARQRSLMGENTGRQGTILTGLGAQASGLGSGTGKTLLGS